MDGDAMRLTNSVAVSSPKCNKLMMMLKEVEGLWHKQFSGASEVEALARSGVELLGNGIEVGLRETGEVGALRDSADLPALRWSNAHHRVHHLQRRHAQNLGAHRGGQ